MKYNKLQREWFGDGVPDTIDSAQELVRKCEHDPEPHITGVTGRRYCPRCGKVLDETLTQYKYND